MGENMQRLTYILILLTITCLFGCQEEVPETQKSAQKPAVADQMKSVKQEAAPQTQQAPIAR